MNHAIEVRDLCRSYIGTTGILRKKRIEIRALDQISFEVSVGELFGVLGPNGAGKTTLAKILATVLLPTSGRAEILGFDIVSHASDVRRQIGLVFGGDLGLYSYLSVADNLRFWAALYKIPGSNIPGRVEAVINMMGLGTVANRRVEDLSRGMRQRLHLARGMLPRPSVLILDEPTIGLDPVAASALREIIRESQEEGITIFLTTHNMREAEVLCDRIAIIDQGQIRYLGTPNDLKKQVDHLSSMELLVEGGAKARLEQIQKWPCVQSLSITEEMGLYRVLITYSEDAAFISGIIRHLDGTRIIDLRRREYSLEDAYITIIGDRGLELEKE